MKTAAIIAAAGRGVRFGKGLKKQFQPLCGKPLICYSIESFEASPSVAEIILVVPEDSITYCSGEIVEKFGFKKVSRVVSGGGERQHSVESGFDSLSEGTNIVLVHDGARPLITVEIIEKVIKEASISGGAVAALPIRDTIKESSTDNLIERTLSRESLWVVQTPQGFRHDILKRAYQEAREEGFLGTDESSLVERIGAQVKLVTGSGLNIKITTEEDLALVELILKRDANNVSSRHRL